MRLWTVHPCYLDAKGLVAAWREALLAQKVLQGATRGYRYHRQLARFRSHPDPLAAIAAFLAGIAREAKKRGYCFDTSKIGRRPSASKLAETRPAAVRMAPPEIETAPARPRAVPQLSGPRSAAPAPLFRIVPGKVRNCGGMER